MRDSQLGGLSAGDLLKVFEYSNDGIYVVDPAEGRILGVNRAACEMLGYSREELLALPITSVHPLDLDVLGKFAGVVSREGHGSTTELTCTTKSGEVLPTEISASMGEIDGRACMIAIVRDISERKRAEDGLREMAVFAEQNPQPLVRFDAGGKILIANAAALELLERKEDGTADLGSILPGTEWTDLASVIADGIEYSYALSIGDRVYQFLIKGVPELGVGHIYGSDITEHKRSEERAKRSEDSAKRLAEENAFLAELGQIIGSSLDIEEVFDHFAIHLSELIPFDRLAVCLCEREKQTITPIYVSGLEVSDWGQGEPYPVSDSRLETVINDRVSIVYDSQSTEEHANLSPGTASGFSSGLLSGIGVPLISQGKVIGVLNISSQKPRAYSEREKNLAQSVASQISGAIANAQLYAAHTTTSRALSVFNRLMRKAVSSLDVTETIDEVADLTREIIEFDHISLFLYDPQENLLTPFTYTGYSPRTPHDLDINESAVGLVAHTGQPVMYSNVIEQAGSEYDRLVAKEQEFGSAMFLPLASRGKNIGVLVLANCNQAAYTEYHLELAGELADHLSIIIDASLLYAESRELAVLEERNRIAREIHDSIAQGLTGIIWQLNVMSRSAAQGGDQAVQTVNRVRDIARECLQEARRSVWDLRVGPMQGTTLAEALRKEIDKLSESGAIDAKLEVRGSEAILPAGMETALLRICQESIANILKHAKASRVVVSLDYGDDTLGLKIEDDGAGFDPDMTTTPRKRETGGFGLINMRERARLLGGDLSVQSAKGEGTRIEAILPLRSAS